MLGQPDGERVSRVVGKSGAAHVSRHLVCRTVGKLDEAMERGTSQVKTASQQKQLVREPLHIKLYCL